MKDNMTEITILPPNKDIALQLKDEIESQLGQINSHELRLATCYVRLGRLLWRVKTEQHWIEFGYDKFTSYLEYVRARISRERSQVYNYISVAETLLPLLSEQQLEKVGITKANELQRLVKQGGRLDTVVYDGASGDGEWEEGVHLLDYASDPKVTAAQLRVKINEILHVYEPGKGSWFELGGFYVLPEEKLEIEEFWAFGRNFLVEPGEQQDHEVKKEVFFAAIRESMSTWQAESEEGR